MFNRIANWFMAGVTMVATALGFMAPAHAAVDPSVTTAITGAGTDAGTIAAAVLVVIVGIWAYKLLRKAL